jgi:hypothetical protein
MYADHKNESLKVVKHTVLPPFVCWACEQSTIYDTTWNNDVI